LSEYFAENPVPDDFSIPKAERPDKKNRIPQTFPLAKEGDPVYGNDESTMQREGGMVESQNVKASWAGGTGSGRPFDPSGAVGPNHYIQMINATVFRVYNKTGTVLLTGTLGNLWSPAVGNYGDPIVMYDKPANRWFLAQFGSGNQIYIAVSQTADPLGSWFTYTYISPEFPDYLKFGVWHDAYYMTSNQGTQKVYAFNRNEILAGTPGARSIYTNYSPPQGGGFFCPLPADAGDGSLPAPGTPCPILSYSDNGWGGGFTDAVHIYNMSINWVPVTPTATITLAANVSTAPFNSNYNPSWLDCPQPGTTQKLDGIGGVLMYRAQWKSWPGYNTLVLNWGVEISAAQRGIKWCELRQTGGVWSMYQEGIYTPGSDTRWMGTIAMNDQGSIGLCYLRSNTTTMYPSLYYTGRRTCDPLGTLPVTETLVAAGTGSQFGFGNPNASKRVGDYAHMSIDPSNGTTFWATGEFFGGPSGTGAARTQIFSFDIAPCVVLTAGVTIGISGGSNPTCGSAEVSFTASPTNGGSAPSYQWKVNGVNVGTNNPIFSSTTLLAGDVVTCVMTSNLAGVVGNPATSNAITMMVSSPPAIGTASISPSSICLGETTTVTYTAPTCEDNMGFQNTYAPANWSLSLTNSDGTVNTSLAPASISMVSSNNGISGGGSTNYTITVPCSGNITFNWSYSTSDGALYDYPVYTINGGLNNLFPGYSTAGANNQSGTASIAVNAGDVLTLNAYSADGGFGPCTVVINNFNGPALPDQHFDIFNAATGGSLLSWSYTNTWDVTPGVPGTFTYYIAAHSNVSGCYSTTRVPVTVTVNPTPQVGTAVISPTSICEGETATITYTQPACETNVGFQSAYDPSNWTLTQVNSNGSINTTQIPGSISMVSSNGLSGAGSTEYAINITCSGNITFDWSYSTIDGAPYDYPSYYINGGIPQFFTGYSTGGGTTQTGTQTIAVNSGDVFTFRMYSLDNAAGPATTVISNFMAPKATNQHFDIFDASSGGTLLSWSYINTLNVTPPSAGVYTYFVAAHENSTGCYSNSRVPVTVTVNPLPALGTVSGSAGSGCLGSTITASYTPITCATTSDFQGVYDPSLWTLALVNSNGTVNTTNAPASISLVSSNGLSGAGNTNYSIQVPCSGVISFSWNYTTLDGALYDYPTYSVNGGAPTIFPGFSTGLGSSPQNGTFSLTVNAGDVFTMDAYSSDNFAGSCTIDLTSWVAPKSLPSQGIVWYDAPTGGNVVWYGTPLFNTPTAPGTYTYYGEVSDASCTNTTRVVAGPFTINPLPVVTANSSGSICEGDVGSLQASGALTYLWQPGALTGFLQSVSPVNSTTYTVVGTDANGCTASSLTNIHVKPYPILGTATASPSSLCLGATTTLTYTAPAGTTCYGAFISSFSGPYAPANWSLSQVNSNGTISALGANMSMVSSNGLSGAGYTQYSIVAPCTGIVSFDWSYSTIDGAFYDYPRYAINGGLPQLFDGYSLGGPTSQANVMNIFMNAGDVLSLQVYSSDNVGGSCTVQISNFFAPIPSLSIQGVNWFTAPTGGINLGSSNPQSVTPAAAGSYTYYASVTSSVGCTNPTRVATNTVVVNGIPVANAGPDRNLNCTTPSATVGTAAIGGNTYSWSPATGLSASNIASPTCSANVTTTYTLTVTSAAGCTATDVVVVNVNKTPPSANAGADVTLTCTTPSATIGSAAIGGNTYSWSPATALSSVISANPTTTALATTTYTVTVTGSNGCTATDAVLVTVNKTAPSANAGADVTLTCTTPSATIGSAAIGGNTYSWSPATALSSVISANPTTTALATTTYTVTVTGSNGCTATDAVLVTVNKTAPTANAGADVTLTCTTPSATIGTTAVVGNTYSWSPNTSLSSASSATPTTTALVTTTYTVTVTGSNGCTATDAVLVTVNKTAPTANAGVDKSLNCTTPSTTIGTAAVVGNTYAWSPNTALSSATAAVPTTTALITTTYTVTVTGTNGCTATDAVLVTVNKTPPTVTASATSISIACGASTSLSATGATSYTWQPGSLSGTPVTVSPTATTTYTVTGTAANGCTATATRLITVAPCGSTLNVKLFIEGFYMGGSMMQPALLNQGVVGATASQADSITVELHNSAFPYALVATQKRILNTNGTSTGNFAVSGNYYIAVRHRNGVHTWSSNPVLVSGTTSYDFSNLASKAYGSNQVEMEPGVWAIYSGDINQDLTIDAFDYIELDPDVIAGLFGYLSTDLTGDGVVDAFDYIILDPNITLGISSVTP
jgi:hypothetical protein